MMTILLNRYDSSLVVLSFVIATFSFYTVFRLLRLLKEGTDYFQIALLISGLIAIGVGIWSTHFFDIITAILIVLILTFTSVICNQKVKIEKSYSRLLEEKNSSLIESQKKLLQSEAELQKRAENLEQIIQELQQLQLQIIQSEKMTILGNLVTGVAYEINNPVTFIAGNINPAIDYIESIFKLVDLYQQKYPNPDIEIQYCIENIDLHYIREDLPKLIFSMKEEINRIYNISMGLRMFSRIDSDIEKNGGTLEVNTVEEEGTEFLIKIPNC